MTKTNKVLAILVACLISTGCSLFKTEQFDSISSYSEPRFQNSGKIELKVNKIDIISEFTPSFRRPNIEHLLPISIEKSARIWANDRLEGRYCELAMFKRKISVEAREDIALPFAVAHVNQHVAPLASVHHQPELIGADKWERNDGLQCH